MLAGRFMNLCVAAIQKDHRQRTALYVLQDILTTYPGTVSAAVRSPDLYQTSDCAKLNAHYWTTMATHRRGACQST